MKEGGFLLAVAQIGAVYVGFSTLIVVIVRQFAGPRVALEAARLDSMLRLSFLAVIFSLFPCARTRQSHPLRAAGEQPLSLLGRSSRT